MTIETDLSQTEYDAFRLRTTGERENDCSAAPGVPQGSAVTSDRHLRAVPSSDGTDRSGRNRTARRAEGHRMRTELRTEGGGLLHWEAGMATAEYAIATLAAVGFAALLVAVLSSGQIKGLLTSLITTALNFG
jgi:hypothetical protein